MAGCLRRTKNYCGDKVKNVYGRTPQLTQTVPVGKYPCWLPKPRFVFFLGVYAILVVLFSITTAGYQFVPIVTTSWDDTNSFWFESFIPASYRPRTRICGAHTFRVGVVTSSPLSFLFDLTDFLDTSSGVPLDEVIYGNSDFVNCSVISFSVSQAFNAAAQEQITIACNTTDGQVLVLSASEQSNLGANAGLRSVTNKFVSPSVISQVNSTQPLNISEAIQLFYLGVIAITEAFIPDAPGSESLLVASLGTNYSSITLSYGDGPYFIPDDQWTLNIHYTKFNDSAQYSYIITFNSNGSVDEKSSNLTAANELLSPTIAAINLRAGTRVDAWQLVNWYMVSLYWTFLYQFGDMAPTMYNQDTVVNTFTGQISLSGLGNPNFSSPISYLPTNNIFWNDTLFQIYSNYVIDTLLPLVPIVGSSFRLITSQMLPLSDTNRIERSPTTILTSYQCSQMVWKGWVSALISILVAISSLWTGGYKIALLLLSRAEPEQSKGRVEEENEESGNEKLT